MHINVEHLLSKLYEESISDGVVTYHGDDFGTSKVTIKNMWLDGNSQEGIGIYFGPASVAEGYGKYISKALVDPSRYIESRENTLDAIGVDNLAKILEECWKADAEQMYYLATDYGIDIPEPEDIEDYHMEMVAGLLGNNEIRHIQVEIVQAFNIEILVKAWMKVLPDVHGLKESDNEFFIVINTGVGVTPVNF